MKNIIIGLLIVVNLRAENYEELLEQAMQNNAQLKIVQSQQEELSIQGQINTRLTNPKLELEVADFSSSFLTKSNKFGGRAGLSQSLLLPHIKEDKENITAIEIEVEKERYSLQKSDFIYRFNLKYLDHSKAVAKVELHRKVLNISQDLLEIVRQRYEHGAIAKSEFLEAKLADQVLLNQLQVLKFEVKKFKNSLLTFSSLPQQTNIEGVHLFQPFSTQNTHPFIKLNRAEKKVSQAKLELLQHSVESVEVFSELEREPDQDVFRVGFSIDLPTFNLHNEEKQLEKIKISNHQLLIATQEREVNLKIEQLKAEQMSVEELSQGYAQFILEQKELFYMYQQSYKLAKVNFIKLQKVLQSIVKTEKKLLTNRFSIKENVIKINYLLGAYNE